MSDEPKVPLPELDQSPDVMPRADAASLAPDPDDHSRSAADLEAVFDVPVQVSAVLGRAKMDVGELRDYIAGLQDTLTTKIQQQREFLESQLAGLGVYANNKAGAAERLGSPRALG